MRKFLSTKWLIPAIFLLLTSFGCGQGQNSANELPTTEQPSADTEKATVNFKINFPQTGKLSKSRLDDSTQAIYVSTSGDCGYQWAQLTKENPAAAMELNPGYCFFSAEAYDGSNNSLDYAVSTGVLTTGANTVVLNFLRGEWSFVDAQNTATPLILAGGEVLANFRLQPWGMNASANIAAFDPSKSYVWKDYSFTWVTDTGATLGYDPTSPWTSEATFFMVSQFNGGSGVETNGNRVEGGYFNITDLVSDQYSSDDPGDRFIWIVGIPGEFENSDVSGYVDSTAVNGTTITGHIFEGAFGSKNKEAVPSSGFCDDQLASSATARNTALAAARTSLNKAASVGPMSSLQLDFIDCEFNSTDYTWTEYQVTEMWTNVYFHPFTATASQLVLPDGGDGLPLYDVTSLFGSWVNSSGNVLTIFDNNKYIIGEDGIPEENGFPGMEYGTFNYDAHTGDFYAFVITQSNGDWGPAGMDFAATKITVSGNTLTIFSEGEGYYPFERIQSDPTNPIVGSWAIGDETAPTVLTFLADGTYLVAHNDAADETFRGIGKGTYTVDGTILTANGTLQTFNSDAGVAGPGETDTFSVTVSGNELYWTERYDEFDPETYVFYRVN